MLEEALQKEKIGETITINLESFNIQIVVKDGLVYVLALPDADWINKINKLKTNKKKSK